MRKVGKVSLRLAKKAIHLPGEPMQLKVVIEGKSKPFFDLTQTVS